MVVLWGGVGVQYSAHNPVSQIQNASNIQTLSIIAGKKKAPVKGPQFIVGCVNCGCVHPVLFLTIDRTSAP